MKDVRRPAQALEKTATGSIIPGTDPGHAHRRENIDSRATARVPLHMIDCIAKQTFIVCKLLQRSDLAAGADDCH